MLRIFILAIESLLVLVNQLPEASRKMWGTTGTHAGSMLIAICLGLLNLTGCSKTLYPVTSGFHAPIDKDARDKKFRFVVWSNHPGVANYIIGELQKAGHTVVERARLQEIFNEQKIRLTNTSDDDADVLRVGKLLGAERVIFAEVSIRGENFSQGYYHPQYGGGSASGTVYQTSVAIRGVSIETGEIRWSGTASYPGPINNPDQGVMSLASWATARALCRTEEGYEWKDPPVRFGKEGCFKKE